MLGCTPGTPPDCLGLSTETLVDAMPSIIRLVACCLALLFIPEAAGALSFETGRIFELTQDNDWFGGSDRWNTNEVRFTYISAPLEKDAASRVDDRMSLASLPLWESPGFLRNWSASLGQAMFTPESLSTKELIEDDRPYAGWLYIALGLNKQSTRQLDALELTLGVVGPWALAEEAQTLVHAHREPEGWDNQLRNEPGFILSWQRYLRATAWSGPGWGHDVIPHLGFAAGNVYTFANTGLELRAGYNLPSDFGTSMAWPTGRTTLAPSSPDDPRIHGRWGWHVFLAADGRYVARNIFLDGNTWRDSHSVDREDWVADLSAGLSLNLKRVKVTYTHAVRTKEFKGQPEEQWQGSVSLAVAF